MRRTLTLCLILVTAALFMAPQHVHAQETGAAKRQADPALTNSFSARARQELTNMSNQMNQSCGSVPHNSALPTEACPDGMSGTIRKTCSHGRAVITGYDCRRMRPCGSHAHGSTWGGSCPNGMQGTLEYACFDGNTVVHQFDCRRYQCNGTTLTGACAPTADNIPMQGTITYSCSNNVLTMTRAGCYTYNKPCGNLPHGGAERRSCGEFSASLSGDVWMTCNDGNRSISSFNCTYIPRACGSRPDRAVWTENCLNNLDGTMDKTCADGTALVTRYGCNH